MATNKTKLPGNIRFTCIIYLFFSLQLIFGLQVADAQTVNLSQPTGPTTVTEGDSFAGLVLGNEWDFNERRDFAWEQHFSPQSISVAGGIWTGTNLNESNLDGGGDPQASGFVMPLFAGFPRNVPVIPLAGDKTLPKSGLLNKIDTTKYTVLSYKMNHSNRSDSVVTWRSDTPVGTDELFPTPSSPLIVFEDGYDSFGSTILNTGFNIYTVDLTDPTRDLLVTSQQGTWVGEVHSLRLEPSLMSSDGDTVQYDWIRLVDPTSAPDMTITFDSQGFNSGTFVATVYVDTDASGFDGVPMHVFGSYDPFLGDTNLTFSTAILPPGDYFFYVTIVDTMAPTNTATSAYSPRLRILAAPSAFFTAPTRISGESYAATVVGNDWDMDEPADIANEDVVNFSSADRNYTGSAIVPDANAERGGAIFEAESEAVTFGPNSIRQSPRVRFRTAPFKPIDPKKYRYAAYNIAADDTAFGSILSKTINRWFSTIIFGNIEGSQAAGGSKGIPFFEGSHTYTLDLKDPNSIEGAEWESFHRLADFSLIPFQSTADTLFEIDWVQLSAENRTSSGEYTVSFTVEDEDSTSVNVGVFYDTDDVGFNGTQFASLPNIAPGTHSVTWDSAGIGADGDEFFFYVIVDDGNHQTSWYSPVGVIKGDFVPTPAEKAVNDYDSDGLADQAVYRAAQGQFFQNRTASFAVLVQWVAGANYQPLRGDFDGDGTADIGVVFEFFGFLAWYVHHSSDNTVRSVLWGFPGDQIAVADYNGNGRDQIAVFRDGAWFILDANNEASVGLWGMSGDIAVPADYDGDEKADLAIWREADGNWWVLFSGFANNLTPNFFEMTQWGLPGDIPLAADWFNRGKTDLGVYRPSTGQWFLRRRDNGDTETAQWGLPGDMPVVDDYNGDNYPDFSVFRESNGFWFHNFRSRTFGSLQFGLPGDKVPGETAN